MRAAWNRLCEFTDRYPVAVFWVLIALLCLYLQVPYWLSFDAAGLHFIRQTDSLSYMMGYFQFHAPFLEPQLYDLAGEDGRAAAEFPVYYYLAAQLARIFGPHGAILRILYFATSLLGLWSFFRMAQDEFRRFFPAFFLTLLAFSGTSYWYYAVGLVPDIAALSWTLVALRAFGRAYFNGKRYALILFVLAFVLTGLIKVTFLLYLLAVIGAVVFHLRSGDYRAGWNRRQWLIRLAGSTLLIGLTAVAWITYVRAYNQTYGNLYFLTEARPIWSLDAHAAWDILDFVLARWSKEYFHPLVWMIWGIALVWAFYEFRREWRFSTLLAGISLLGLICYALLFYRQFGDHDYYFVVFYPFFAFLGMDVLLRFRNRFPRLFSHPLLAVAAVYLLYVSYDYQGGKVRDRFLSDDFFAVSTQELKGFHHTLDSLQISDTNRFAVLGDPTVMGSLYYLRRKGHTYHDSSENQMNILRIGLTYKVFDYALSYRGYELGELRQEFGMEEVYAQNGIRVYRIHYEGYSDTTGTEEKVDRPE